MTVLNGSGASHQAANVAGALQRVGFGIDSMADASTIGLDQVDRTQVRYAKGDLDAAKLVASHLTAPVTLMVDPNVTAGTVEVVTGTNFTTVSTTTRSLQRGRAARDRRHDDRADQGLDHHLEHGRRRDAQAGRQALLRVAGSPGPRATSAFAESGNGGVDASTVVVLGPARPMRAARR